jgi:hypothetical protein
METFISVIAILGLLLAAISKIIETDKEEQERESKSVLISWSSSDI